jgi:hypothetical protein
MAIIVLQHTVADNYQVDPNYSIILSGMILAGSLIGLNSFGYVQLAGLTNPLAIAGDSLANEYHTTPYSADLVISPNGHTRWTQNSVANYFNETVASGMMTAYTTGGRFATDQYVNSAVYTPGAVLYSNGSGLFTSVNGGSARTVGYVAAVPAEFPSGVPGTDVIPGVVNTADNSISLGTYLIVQLSI